MLSIQIISKKIFSISIHKHSNGHNYFRYIRTQNESQLIVFNYQYVNQDLFFNYILKTGSFGYIHFGQWDDNKGLIKLSYKNILK